MASNLATLLLAGNLANIEGAKDNASLDEKREFETFFSDGTGNYSEKTTFTWRGLLFQGVEGLYNSNMRMVRPERFELPTY